MRHACQPVVIPRITHKLRVTADLFQAAPALKALKKMEDVHVCWVDSSTLARE